MPKYVIKAGPSAVYRYNRDVYKYTPFASMIATLIQFEGVKSPNVAAAKEWRYRQGAKS